MTDQALLTEFGERAERLGDGLRSRCLRPRSRRLTASRTSRPRCSRFSRTWAPRSSGSCEARQLPSGRAPGAHLGDDAQVRRVRMQRLPDQLVDGDWAVEVAGIDVGDAADDGFAQDGEAWPGPGEDRRPWFRPSCMAPKPIRLRTRLSASLSVPPGALRTPPEMSRTPPETWPPPGTLLAMFKNSISNVVVAIFIIARLIVQP